MLVNENLNLLPKKFSAKIDLQLKLVDSKLLFLLAMNFKHRKLIQLRSSILYSMKEKIQ